MKQPKFYQNVKVVHVPFEETKEEEHVSFLIPSLSIIDLLTLIADLPLREQCHIVLNILTVSGFSQLEISEAMKVSYIDYRVYLTAARKNLKQKPPK